MSDGETSASFERKPACDTCKARKTKCDRKSPCSSCITLKAPCRVTRRPPEKRQRILISSKYDDAMMDVSRQLNDVKEMLESLVMKETPSSSVGSGGHQPSPTPIKHPVPIFQHDSPRDDNERVPDPSNAQEGYKGDSSFHSHADKVKRTLEAAYATVVSHENSPGSGYGAGGASSGSSPAHQPHQKQLSDVLSHVGDSHFATTTEENPSNIQYIDPELERRPLPPTDIVLKILRLVKRKKQRWFIDTTLVSEDEFINWCRDVFFPTDPASLWAWIIVNVALYYILYQMNETDRESIHVSPEEVDRYGTLLGNNAHAATRSLRLCLEPSIDSCRALAILGTFHVKAGHTTVGWRLFTGGARACLDLGFHRLPPRHMSPELELKHSIFWHIYAWEKALAITCGRAPVIPQYDITTEYPANEEARKSVRGRAYSGFLDYAVIAGEVHRDLFSASARELSPEVRNQRVRSFASRLNDILKSLDTCNNQDDPTYDPAYSRITVSTTVMVYSLITLVYRTVPPDPNKNSKNKQHPLQCCDECVEAARLAIQHFTAMGHTIIPLSPKGWGWLLNMLLSLVPIVSFIVLLGSAIANNSVPDLELLESFIGVLSPSPVAAASENNDTSTTETRTTMTTAQKMFDVCDTFFHMARQIMIASSSSSFVGDGGDVQQQQQQDSISSTNDNNDTMSGVMVGGGVGGGGNQLATTTLEPGPSAIFMDPSTIPMAQQDWNSYMLEFPSDMGATHVDPATITGFFEPYMMNMAP